MERKRREHSDVIANRLDEYKVQKNHSRRAFLTGVAVSSAIATLAATAAATGLNRILNSDSQIRVKFDVNFADPGVEVNPETRKKASLQIFKDFVSIYINKEHDNVFWTSMFDFMRSAPESELNKYFDGDISKPDGALHVTWPQNAPINRDDKPIIEMEHLMGNDGGGVSDLTRFMMRLTPDGKINTDREAPNPPKKLFGDKGEMKAILSRVFKEGTLKKNDGWTDTAFGVTKHVQIQREGIDFSMNEYGYVFLSARYYNAPPSPPPITA